MYLFLILLLYTPVLGRFGGPNPISRNSRFGGFNSRLGLRKFPVRMTTGIRPQGLDFARVFCGLTAAGGAKSRKFPAPREKPGTYRNTSGGLPRRTWPMVS
jgi:hypothetical protein